MLVLDASVIVKWFHPEKDAEKALKIRENFLLGLEEVSVPPLLFYELTSALSSIDRVPVNMLKSCVDDIFLFGFQVKPLDKHDLYRSAELTHLFKVTVYDACYLALAERLRCLLITSDEKFARKMGKHPLLKLLSEYS